MPQPYFTKRKPLVADEHNPWKTNPKTGVIQELPEITKIKQELMLLQQHAISAGTRNPMVDLMIRLTKELERQHD